MRALYKLLLDEFSVEDKHIFLNNEKNRIELDLVVLEKIVSILKKQGFECYMVEEYPTADGLEVERAPL